MKGSSTTHNVLCQSRKALAVAIFALSGQAFAQDYAALAHADRQWGFLDEYCTTCHNFEDYSGGLDMTFLSVEEVPQDAEIWEKVIRKLN